MLFNVFCFMRKLVLISSLLIFVSSIVYADDTANKPAGKKVITVATLTNFKMVAEQLMGEYLKTKGLSSADVEVKYIDSIYQENLVAEALNASHIDIMFAGNSSTTSILSAAHRPVYNESIYSYGHIVLMTNKEGKKMKDLLSCKFDVLVTLNSKKTTYGIPADKFLNDNKINCPNARIISVNNTVDAGDYLNKGADFVITVTSIADKYSDLQKSGDVRYKNLAVFELYRQSNLKPPSSVPRFMFILNKDYVDFAEFMHVNLKAHAILHTYGFSLTN